MLAVSSWPGSHRTLRRIRCWDRVGIETRQSSIIQQYAAEEVNQAMRSASIIGVGMTQFGKLSGRGLIDLATEACRGAVSDAQLTLDKIQAFYLGNFASEVLVGQGATAAMVARSVGLHGIPATKVEGACASAGIALRHAYLAVASGLVDIAMAAGVEKMSAAETPVVTAALSCAADRERDSLSGLSFPGFFALVMRRYQYEFGAARAQIAAVPAKR